MIAPGGEGGSAVRGAIVDRPILRSRIHFKIAPPFCGNLGNCEPAVRPGCRSSFWAGSMAVRAGVAQLVEHLICNQTVGGSSPFASSRVPFADRARAGSRTDEMAFRPARNIPPQSFHTDGIFPLSWLRGKASAEWVVRVGRAAGFFAQTGSRRSAIVHRWPSG